ncbi:regulator [Streptomyces sp. NPDC001941]|uniref:ATP-binding protein n=1 Tax=Streptomyces sp. NPDC001941 TaxID=3154659 RepID=UPI00332DA24E
MRNRIPEHNGAFVGRVDELARVEQALAANRLVTLTGSGGVGKSRLAAEAAGDRGSGREADWAPLWSLRDATLLEAVVADALGLADHTDRAPLDTLIGWIGERPLLLVLDSCEHLLESCRTLVARLLADCPRLTVLATSREPLRLRDEKELRIEPLEPASEGLELFLDRAAAAGWHPRDNADLVVARWLSAWLEGLPLALELVAAELRRVTLAEAVRQLRSRLDVPVAAAPARPERHRALRTTVGWSHELCDPRERLLWARLSLLNGAFDADTVRAVCAWGPIAASDVEPLLAALADKSVLTPYWGRYRMLETLREYGAMWLGELGERAALADRHAAHHLALARQAEREWLGPGQADWYRRVGDAYPDLCAALDHYLGKDPELALELASLVGFFWVCCGHLHEARTYLERTLAMTAEPGPARVRAQWALGVAHVLVGNHGIAGELARRCHDEAMLDGAVDGVLDAAYLKGLGELLGGRPESALAAADDALALAGPARDPFDSAARVRCRLVRVFALTGAGRFALAREEAERLRRECVTHGEHWTRSYTDYQLSLISLLRAEPEAAASHARAMLTAKRRIGDSFGTALGLDLLSAALTEQGHAERAALLHGAGNLCWESVGHPQRGTPEVAPLRERCERGLRVLLGHQEYERTVDRAREIDHDRLLAWAIGEGPQP